MATGGRVVAVTAAGGVLAATAVVGTQVAGQSADVARAGMRTPDKAETPNKAENPSQDKASDAGNDRKTESVSRGSTRPSLTELKKQSLHKEPTVTKSATGVITKKAKVDVSDPKGLAKAMLSEFGWSEDQFQCLDDLWVGESNWRANADNPSSSAYGIPQALPGSKMASAGADWETNPATQIKWGLGYIKNRYGSPCEANSFKQGNNFY